MNINKLLLSVFLIASSNAILTMEAPLRLLAPKELVYPYYTVSRKLLSGKTAESIDQKDYNGSGIGFPPYFKFLPNTAQNRARVFEVAKSFNDEEISLIGIETLSHLLCSATYQINLGLKG